MQEKDKKLAVLRVLEASAQPLGLRELMEGLGPEFSDRTVRRWLGDWVLSGQLTRTGQKRGTKYLARSTSFAVSGSKTAIDYVKQPIYERNPVVYNAGWLDDYTPNVTFYLPEKLRAKLYNCGLRASDHDPAGTYAHQIFNRLLIDLSYNSSRLEGNTYSLIDTERLILSGKEVEGKLDEEKVMILNHKEAIRYLVENASRMEVSYQTICTLHYLLADGLLEAKQTGKMRDHWIRITGSTYIPLEDPDQLQLQMQKIADKAKLIDDAFEQSFFLLVHVGYLQAFSDANKRTARLCSNIPLIIKNLVPLSFNGIERGDYMNATLAIYELQDVRPMVDLFSLSYIHACAVYDLTVKTIGFDEVRVRYRQQRRALIREIILQKIPLKSLSSFLKTRVDSFIPAHSQQAFIEDLFEDLEQIDESRIMGLGITSKELKDFLSISGKR